MRVVSGVPGIEAGEDVLRRVEDVELRKLLHRLLRQSGVQGPRALKYVAQLLRWHARDIKVRPEPHAGLSQADIAYCQERAEALLIENAGHPSLPKVLR